MDLEAYIRNKYEFKKWVATGPPKAMVAGGGSGRDAQGDAAHEARARQEEEDRKLAERLQVPTRVKISMKPRENVD